MDLNSSAVLMYRGHLELSKFIFLVFNLQYIFYVVKNNKSVYQMIK